MWTRWPTYLEHLYFENVFEEARHTLDDSTIKIRVAVTEQPKLWTIVNRTPKGMRFVALEIGAYFGFFSMMIAILVSINSIFFRQELTDHVMEKFKSARYKIEDVVSYEQFISMQLFIARLKRNPEIRRILKEDPEGQ